MSRQKKYSVNMQIVQLRLSSLKKEKKKRIYKMNSFSETIRTPKSLPRYTGWEAQKERKERESIKDN